MESISAMAADAIYDILVFDGGADESGREAFLEAAQKGISEYCFRGRLGPRGTFRNADGRWYVDVDPEERKRLRSTRLVAKINRELVTLKSFLEPE